MPRHREALYDVDAGGILAARRAEELATGGHFFEQVFDEDAGTGRKCARPFADQYAVVDDPRPALAASDAALDGDACDAGNRGQGLTAKAHRRHRFDPVIGQFRRGVAFERQSDIIPGHPAPIVADVDAVGSPRCQTHVDTCRSGINRVLDEFLESGCRTFDNFTGGNAIHEMFGQAAY